MTKLKTPVSSSINANKTDTKNKCTLYAKKLENILLTTIKLRVLHIK